MKFLIFLGTLLSYSAHCADSNNKWCSEWNGSLSEESLRYVQERNLSPVEVQEYLIQKAEKNNYLKVRNEIVGTFDARASTTPITPFEAEILYFTVLNGWLTSWQDKLIQLDNLKKARGSEEDWQKLITEENKATPNNKYHEIERLEKQDAETFRFLADSCKVNWGEGENLSFGPRPYLNDGGLIPPPYKDPPFSDLFSNFYAYNKKTQSKIFQKFFKTFAARNDWSLTLLLMKFNGSNFEKYTESNRLTPRERESIIRGEVSSALDRWVSIAWANHQAVSEAARCTEIALKADIEKAKSKSSVHVKKLMEIPHHLVSHLAIQRTYELLGYEMSNDIKIPPGMKRWNFQLSREAPSSGGPKYFLHDFRWRYFATLEEKRGGRTLATLKTVCIGVLACFGGMRTDPSLIPNELNSIATVEVIDRDGKPIAIPGLYNRMFTDPCESRGILDPRQNKPGCGEPRVELGNEWKETY